MYMVMYVLDNPDLLDALLDAWEAAGLRGVTVIESTGLQRHRARRQRIPMRFPFDQGPQHSLEDHYTLFSIVENMEAVDRCIAATEKLVGDLHNPHTGVLASWALEVVRGLPKKALSKKEA